MPTGPAHPHTETGGSLARPALWGATRGSVLISAKSQAAFSRELPSLLWKWFQFHTSTLTSLLGNQAKG